MKLPTKYGSYKIYVRKTNTERPKFICDLYRKRHDRSCNHYYIFGNCEEEPPKNLSADCRSTVGRQVTDSLPTANQQVKKKEKLC